MPTDASLVKLGPRITSRDRLSFTFFLAITFHILLILGVSFKFPELESSSSEPTIEIVLAQYHDKNKPEKADFLGQADQQGGGNQNAIIAPSNDQLALIPDPTSRRSSPPVFENLKKQNEISTVLSMESQEKVRQKEDYTPEVETANQQEFADNYLRQVEIADLTAQLEAKRVAAAKRYKKRQVSAAIHRASDAMYLDAWRRKVEQVGNLNYPEEAKRRGLYGKLILKVAINKNGAVHNIKVLQSSGHKLLDDAAVRIVRMASPFAPLTKKMKEDTDILEIVRLWQFEPGNRISAK